jgi:hypothetical protein
MKVKEEEWNERNVTLPLPSSQAFSTETELPHSIPFLSTGDHFHFPVQFSTFSLP